MTLDVAFFASADKIAPLSSSNYRMIPILKFDEMKLKSWSYLDCGKVVVCGMQRQRASSAEKGIPAARHCDSIPLSIVSLLLALSMTNAIIYNRRLEIQTEFTGRDWNLLCL
jgi:hypothetical protein